MHGRLENRWLVSAVAFQSIKNQIKLAARREYFRTPKIQHSIGYDNACGWLFATTIEFAPIRSESGSLTMRTAHRRFVGRRIEDDH